MKLCLIVGVLWMAFAASSRAEPLALASLPDLQSANYKVDPYIQAAVQLQKVGRTSACQTLLAAARLDQGSQQIIILCRMLFVQRGTLNFKRPAIGGATFLGGTDYADWPLEPIEIVDGIPFAVTIGYILADVAEPADVYLKYCMTNCDWNATPYRTATGEQKRAALAKLLASGKWKKPLSAYEQRSLSSQAE